MEVNLQFPDVLNIDFYDGKNHLINVEDGGLKFLFDINGYKFIFFLYDDEYEKNNIVLLILFDGVYYYVPLLNYEDEKFTELIRDVTKIENIKSNDELMNLLGNNKNIFSTAPIDVDELVRKCLDGSYIVTLPEKEKTVLQYGNSVFVGPGGEVVINDAYKDEFINSLPDEIKDQAIAVLDEYSTYDTSIKAKYYTVLNLLQLGIDIEKIKKVLPELDSSAEVKTM